MSGRPENLDEVYEPSDNGTIRTRGRLHIPGVRIESKFGPNENSGSINSAVSPSDENEYIGPNLNRK